MNRRYKPLLMDESVEDPKWREVDIEKEYHVVINKTPAAAVPVKMGCFKLSALGVVGRLANIIRTVCAVGLGVSAIITFLMALGVLVGVFVAIKLLYVCAVVEFFSVLLILFDTATAKWIVERILVQLASDVKQLEYDLKESAEQIRKRDKQLEVGAAQLATSMFQIQERDKQLVVSNQQLEISAEQIRTRDEQIRQQERVIEKTLTIQGNMRELLTSLMAAESDGANLNDLFTSNLEKFERLLNRMSGATFSELDANHDGVVDFNEFRIYTSKSVTREIHFK
jgi:hypothetical protein